MLKYSLQILTQTLAPMPLWWLEHYPWLVHHSLVLGDLSLATSTGVHWCMTLGALTVHPLGVLWRIQCSLRSVPLLRLFGCWKSEIPVPWNESVAVVVLGLWSMLSTAAVVNKPWRTLGGHTTWSRWYCSHTQLPIEVDISITPS